MWNLYGGKLGFLASPLVALVLCLLVQSTAADDYVFVSPFDFPESVYADAAGVVALGSTAAGTVMNFSSPTAILGQPSDTLSNGWFEIAEWANFALAGTELAHKPVDKAPNVYAIFAAEAADVTVWEDGVIHSTVSIAPGTVEEVSGDFRNKLMEFGSTTAVLITVHSTGSRVMPVPPVAQTIFGQCSNKCEIRVYGGDDGVSLTRSCTNGTVEEVPPGNYEDLSDWEGESCHWSAPSGYKLLGSALGDGSGIEGAIFLAADYFQLVTPMPVVMSVVLLISTGPAVCTYGGGSVTLTGAVGVFHGRLTDVAAGTVFECDLPVTAIGEATCPAEFAWTCEKEEVNIITAAFVPTTTTSTRSTTTLSVTSTTVSTLTTTATNTTTTLSTVSTTTTSATVTTSATTTTLTSQTSTCTTTTTATTSTTPTSTTTTSATTSTTVTTTTTATTTSTTSTITSTSTSTTPTTTTTNTSTTTTNTTTSTVTSSSTATATWTPFVAAGSSATTTSLATAPGPAVLVERVESLEAALVSAVVDTNATRSTEQVDNFTIVAVKLDAASVEAAGGSATVSVDGTEVAITVPASLFDSLDVDNVVLVLALFDQATTNSMGSGTGEVEVFAAVNLNVRAFTGTRIPVTGLADPITLVLPANYRDDLQCAYWDEASSDWATDGVVTSRSADGLMLCEAYHLTLFAAIARGFLKTFQCSQASLLNMEALRELGSPDWYLLPGALLLWSLIGTFVLLLVLAAILDWSREKRGSYNDEHFLIALDVIAAPVESEEAVEEADGPQAGTSSARVMGSTCIESCRTSGALRDALDDVISSWVSRFSEMRDLVEGLFEGLDLSNIRAGLNGNCVSTTIHRLMSVALSSSSKRQAAASLGISQDTSSFLMEDEDVNTVLMAQRTRKHSSSASTTSFHTLRREESWNTLHGKVASKLDRFTSTAAHWSALPGTVCRLFLWQNPVSICLLHCSFSTSKTRVLFFAVDVIGSLMLSTVFFAATGTPGKRNRSQDCKAQGIGELIGRSLAVATGSLLTASLPTLFLESLCTRGVKKFDYEGCPEWERQLSVWRIQDRAIWFFGLVYVAFCTFFTTLFLANVAQKDQRSWLLSGLIAVTEDTLLIPLCVAAILPLICALCLSCLSCGSTVKKQELVTDTSTAIKREGNWTLSVETV